MHFVCCCLYLAYSSSGIVDITTNHFCSPNKCQECDMLMHLNLNARITVDLSAVGHVLYELCVLCCLPSVWCLPLCVVW